MPGRSAGLRKLDSESLYYSCQVCSNHVGYFNKREQQGETGSLVLRLLLRVPFVTLLLLLLLFSGHPTYLHAHTHTHIYRLRLYRDFDDPVTVCVSACSFSSMLKILGSGRIQMEIRIFFGGNPVSTIVDPSMFSFRLDASIGPRDSLISERPTREHASDIFIFDIRRTISLARSEERRGGIGMEVDGRLRARTVAEKNRWSRVPVGIKGAREQFSICKKARFRNSRRRRAASFFSSSSSLSGKTRTRVLKRAFDANANLSS